MIKPWERQEDETRKAYAAFCIYRDLLPFDRSYVKVLEVAMKQPSYLRQLTRWGSRYRWVSRATLSDDNLDLIRRQRQEQEIGEMAVRQAANGIKLQSIGMAHFLDEDGEVKKDIPEMTPYSAISAVSTGTKIERTARGEPTAIIEDGRAADDDVRALSDEQLIALITEGDDDEC